MPPRPADPAAPATAAQASLYQLPRAHLAVLKLHDAAEHLPAVLDQATAQNRLVALHGRPTPGSCLRTKVHHAVDHTLTDRQIKSGRDQAIDDAWYSAPVDGRSIVGRDGM
jgi:hypothetical protein